MTQKTMQTSEFRPLDVQSIRQDFPIFAENPPLAFLDSAASTQTPRPVVEAMDAYYDTYRSNIHRGHLSDFRRSNRTIRNCTKESRKANKCTTLKSDCFHTEYNRIYKPCRIQLGKCEYKTR